MNLRLIDALFHDVVRGLFIQDLCQRFTLDRHSQIGIVSSSAIQTFLRGITFSTAGNYALTAQYVPTAGSYYLTSTSSTVNIVSNTPVLSAAALSTQQSTIAPGGTALYSFNVTTTLYTGTINFSCSGLPANSTCVFSPASITGTGCNVMTTVALNIYTQAPTTSMQAGFGGTGSGP